MSNLPHINYYYSNDLYKSANSANNYEQFSSPSEDAFVMFYAPWCGHCKYAKPEVQLVLGGIATDYKDYSLGNFKKHNGKLAVIMVNGDDHPELTKKFDVTGFPTFKLLKGIKDRNTLTSTSVVEYNGSRNQQEIEQYLIN